MNIDILGYVAGTITSITYIPQIYLVIKNKSAKDISSKFLLTLKTLQCV